ncbi:MAG TPA: ATP-binding cassette domain-containing protein [Petrotogaceae bacterium]|nr:ATP-binding cassette domain-containing protein [Petrotogaceae bacterium]
MYTIQTQDLSKTYKNGVNALNSLNIQVKEGEVFSLLGPNGAGKSSLIKILTTQCLATKGKAFILGIDTQKNPSSIRPLISCVSQSISIDSHMSLKENFIFQARLYQLDNKTINQRMKLLIESFELSDYVKYPVSTYSGGIKRRLDIAMNMISFPKVLFLDEPTTGMDVQSRRAMWDMIQKIKETFRTTIFLTTHYLEEADILSDSICIIKDGKELIQASPYELKRLTGNSMIKIGLTDAKLLPSCCRYIESLKLCSSSYIRGESAFFVSDDSDSSFPLIIRALLDKPFYVKSAEITLPSLEDVFIELTSKKERKEDETVC